MNNPLTSEPIGASTVATIISFLAAKFAFNVDGPTSTAVALVVLAVASWIARALSVPIAKHNATVASAIAGVVAGSAPQTAPQSAWASVPPTPLIVPPPTVPTTTTAAPTTPVVP